MKRRRTKREKEPPKKKAYFPESIVLSEKIKKMRMHPMHVLPPETGEQVLVYNEHQGYDIIIAAVARQHILSDLKQTHPLWRITCWRFLPK